MTLSGECKDRSANNRIEPMTRSAVTVISVPDGLGALLVMAHPFRYAC
jgi:hypothetical protein